MLDLLNRSIPQQIQGLAAHIRAAQPLAAAVLLNGLFNPADSFDDDRAQFALWKIDPDHKAIEADHDAFLTALHKVSPELYDRYDDLQGRLMGRSERAAFALGIAIGQRLSPNALHIDATDAGSQDGAR